MNWGPSKSTVQQYTLRICDCDLTGQWKPSAMLVALQETSGADCDRRGLGSGALRRDNVCWVITHSEIHMLRYPRMGETVTVESLHVDIRRLLMTRCCIFTDENSEVIGYSATNWAILDMTKRRLIVPDKYTVLLPDNSDVTVPLRHPGMVAAVHGEETILTRTPLYSDLDVNGHLTNTRYADWVCDALGTDVMREYALETMRFNYSAEIKADQQIELHVIRDGLNYYAAGYHEGRRHFEMGGTLRRRTAAPEPGGVIEQAQ